MRALVFVFDNQSCYFWVFGFNIFASFFGLPIHFKVIFCSDSENFVLLILFLVDSHCSSLLCFKNGLSCAVCMEFTTLAFNLDCIFKCFGSVVCTEPLTAKRKCESIICTQVRFKFGASHVTILG